MRKGSATLDFKQHSGFWSRARICSPTCVYWAWSKVRAQSLWLKQAGKVRDARSVWFAVTVQRMIHWWCSWSAKGPLRHVACPSVCAQRHQSLFFPPSTQEHHQNKNSLDRDMKARSHVGKKTILQLEQNKYWWLLWARIWSWPGFGEVWKMKWMFKALYAQLSQALVVAQAKPFYGTKHRRGINLAINHTMTMLWQAAICPLTALFNLILVDLLRHRLNIC